MWGRGGLGAGVFAECLHYYHHCHPPLPLAPSLMWYHCTVSGYTIITTTPCIYTLDTLYILGADADFMDRIINTTISNHSDQECVKWHPASCARGIDYLHCWPRDTLSIVRKTLYCIICVKTTIPLHKAYIINMHFYVVCNVNSWMIMKNCKRKQIM